MADLSDSPVGHPHPSLPPSRGKELHFDRRYDQTPTFECLPSGFQPEDIRRPTR